ncbi:MAG: phenylalanine--tRNA ligase subunit alpha [Candidatus Dadabacteria bacterium]|nr:MAG: phenylalanine--tRNA ligase subunit alpha [Candidatus Dadabacteria bacterium]
MDYKKIKSSFEKALKGVSSKEELFSLKAKYIGKKGVISEQLTSLKELEPSQRREAGQALNKIKQEIEGLINLKLAEIERKEIEEKLEKEWSDPTLNRFFFYQDEGGGFHPLETLQRELEDLFLSMGFDILDGPHIEDEYHNFEALNIPSDHPARDLQDTLWFPDMKHLLRTHTSPIQIRGMEKIKQPPLRFVSFGKVFRNERTDASHDMVFHQMEALVVDNGISVAHLLYFLRVIFKQIFGEEVQLRTRPSYFPFVEPGLEIDISCVICQRKGCSVCSGSGWIEMVGAGLVHPNVLKAGGIDAKEYSGFAFGLGLDRLVMMKHNIDDIRLIHGADLRFSKQFKLI